MSTCVYQMGIFFAPRFGLGAFATGFRSAFIERIVHRMPYRRAQIERGFAVVLMNL
jgi:hypothetical protein